MWLMHVLRRAVLFRVPLPTTIVASHGHASSCCLQEIELANYLLAVAAKVADAAPAADASAAAGEGAGAAAANGAQGV